MVWKDDICGINLPSLIALGATLYLQHPKFGALPEGVRLDKIESSLNYADGKFYNLLFAPKLEGEDSFVAFPVAC